jgi:DNA-binding transcriptional ArsR family regulator
LAPKSKASKKSKRGREAEQRLFKALSHPLRFQALMILNERVASPNELSKELGEGLSQVSYHVKVLLESDCIELVKTEPRRGAVEHYYRATSRAFFDDREWAKLPASIKPGFSASLLQTIMDDAAAALKAESFDARNERHLSWTPLKVDEQGWRDLGGLLAETLDRVLEIQAESGRRMAKAKDGESIPAGVAMMSFTTPPSKGKAAKPRSA